MKKIHNTLPIYQELNFLDFKNSLIEVSRKKIVEIYYNEVFDNAGYNVMTDTDEGIFKDLYAKFIEFCKDNFDTYDRPISYKRRYFPMVNNEDYCPLNWHNHIGTSDSMVGVYYLSVPKGMVGGEITFKEESNEFSHRPIENSLVVFPNWLYHTTNYISGKEYRISINMEFNYE